MSTYLIIAGVIGLIGYLIYSGWYILFKKPKVIEYERQVTKYIEVIPEEKAFPHEPWFITLKESSETLYYCWAETSGKWRLKICPEIDPRAKEIIFPYCTNDMSAETLWRFTKEVFGSSIKASQVYVYRKSSKLMDNTQKKLNKGRDWTLLTEENPILAGLNIGNEWICVSSILP